MTSSPIINVAVGILQRPDGTVLLASRPTDKPWPGYWEFPGGKIESGETAYQALSRELTEELGISISSARAWLTLSHDYPTASVRLHCFIVQLWAGVPHPLEGQTLVWQHPSNIDVEPLLPANTRLLRALTLPTNMGITHVEDDSAGFMHRLHSALIHGLKLIQIRDPSLTCSDDLATNIVHLAKQHQAITLVNHDIALAKRVGADGVHLNSSQLAQLDTRPDFAWVGASCHNAIELERAEHLGCDYALLSPVLPTSSHPDAPTLGWLAFNQLTAQRSLPIFALGGMHTDLLATAQQYGAHGIALLRGAWQ